jgi:signal transduction histidine kinase
LYLHIKLIHNIQNETEQTTKQKQIHKQYIYTVPYIHIYIQKFDVLHASEKTKLLCKHKYIFKKDNKINTF